MSTGHLRATFVASSIVPEKFDSCDFVTWLRQFEVCTAAKFLPTFLCGPAVTYFYSLDEGQRNVYGHLRASLTLHIYPAVYREKFYADFESRSKREKCF